VKRGIRDLQLVKPSEKVVVVFVTAPDLKTARKIGRAVLAERLAACANIVPKIESHYWWQGKLESSEEALIIFKTTQNRLATFEATVLKVHPYDTPEIIALPLSAGTEKYLHWVRDSVAIKAAPVPRSRSKRKSHRA
jgi:periplasmic divalent cation tolerance protein